MSETEKEWSFITGKELNEILSEAQDVVDTIKKKGTSMIAAGFAGAALVRMAADSMGGNVEWWCDIIRRGPDTIESFFVPEGASFVKGPDDKQ